MAKTSPTEPVTVRIGGEDHTIRANVKPDYTRRCAKWVDDRISEIRSQLGLIESHKAAILAALSITDELFQARSEVDDLKTSASASAKTLALKLEEALAEEPEPEPSVEDTRPAVADTKSTPEEAQLVFEESGALGAEEGGAAEADGVEGDPQAED